MPGWPAGTNGTPVTLMGEEEEDAAAQVAVLTIVPVFCAMGLLGILVCNLLKKRGYHCTASKEPPPGGTGEPRLCLRHFAVMPHPSFIHLASLCPSPWLLVLMVPAHPAHPFVGGLSPITEPPQFLSPGPSSIYQLEDANEDTIGVLVRLITEKKGRGGPWGGGDMGRTPLTPPRCPPPAENAAALEELLKEHHNQQLMSPGCSPINK